MDRTYFETLHAEERRRAEWRMLDEALRARSHTTPGVRVGIGHALMSLGAWIAGERLDRYTTYKTTC